MADMHTLFKTVDALTPEERERLFHYLEEKRESPEKYLPQHRIPGLFAGGWMSDDFNEELPDEFWGFREEQSA